MDEIVTSHLIDLFLALAAVFMFWRRYRYKQLQKTGISRITKQTKRIQITSFQHELVEYCLDKRIPFIINKDGIFLEGAGND